VPLPLLERASPDNPHYYLDSTGAPSGAICRIQAEPALIPLRSLEAGEQYRFHFDMTKCIGCKCCEVACNEQNGNPVDINWRRVGEIEGGSYPFTQRFYLSMGCNHCLDAACLKGCPVNAYTKDSVTGLVLHSADACIGCQYCTWNCPYGVPQYNPERGVVGKCDMCYGRLAEGREPACVNACPETAIQVEIVNIDEWRADHQAGNAPGMPPVEQTVSTTRITLPVNLTPDLEKADHTRVRPEHPHWPLVFMLVLTQLSVGAFLSLAVSGVIRPLAALASLIVAMLALGASTLHLGRPAHAYRALKMWKRSWLSREVLLFSLFAGAAQVYAASQLLGFTALLQLVSIPTVLLGLSGVTASAFIYLVPARPAWDSPLTIADFQLTGLLLGPLFVSALGLHVVPALIAAAACAQLLNQLLKLFRLTRSDVFELRASARLLVNDFSSLFLIRLALLIVGGIVLPLTGYERFGLVPALAGELVSRYLFFVSVVPRNMAASFIAKEAA
jgi:formate dehydrogenase iron-sulfur subunit